MTTEVDGKTIVLQSLLGEARQEADGLRVRLKQFEQILLSTRLIMGHELKKPVTAITGYLDLVLEDSEGLDSETIENITMAKGECDLLNELNIFFLELLKIDGDSELGRADRVDVRCAVADVISHLPETLAAKKRVNVRVAQNVKHFHINTNAFRIIMTNIIENALQYSLASGQVRVEIEKAPDKRGMNKRTLLKIRVSDDGAGIPSDCLRRIFSPFVRLNEEIEGTGLGLTLVRSLVGLYNGNVFVRSENGEGTTVHVTVPELPHTGDGIVEGQHAKR